MLLALCVSLVLIADEPAYRTDARLTAEVTLAMNTGPVAEVVQELAKQTDARLTVSTDIAELKMTVFCRNRPLNEVMQKIEEAMFFEWVEADGGYRLTYPREIAAEERNLVEQELRLARADIANEISRFVEDSLRPLDELHSERESLLAKMQGLVQNDPERAEMQSRVNRLNRYRDSTYYNLAFMLGQLDSSGLDGFWQGRNVVASTESHERLYRLPPQDLSRSPSVRDMNKNEPVSASALYVMARFTLDRGLEAQNVFSFADTQAGAKVAFLRHHRPPDLPDHPFIRRLDEWTTNLELEESELMSIRIRRRDAEIESPYANGLLGAGEHFEWLSRHADICIVADGFRLPVSFAEPKPGATVGEWLRGFNNLAIPETFTVRPGRFRVSDGWVMYRHGQFWRSKSLEIAEKSFAPIEAATARRVLTVDDYAAFAYATEARQTAAFENRWVLTRFSAIPIVQAHLALRFYGSLTNAQRRGAAADGGLHLSSLNSRQRELYWTAVNEALWVGVVSNERLLKALLVGGDPELESEMRFLLLPPEASRGSVAIRPEAPPRDRETAYQGYAIAPGTTFVFGPSTDMAVTYVALFRGDDKRTDEHNR